MMQPPVVISLHLQKIRDRWQEILFVFMNNCNKTAQGLSRRGVTFRYRSFIQQIEHLSDIRYRQLTVAVPADICSGPAVDRLMVPRKA